ncbi:MAG: LysE family transporter [Proteobacteria bacterium]|nr:LysE family transporter [Pseudomonadota bacterium]
MHDLSSFLLGLAVGVAVAAPVGPVSLFFLRQTLSGGRLTGIAAGLGAASADTFYSSLAAFGITALSGTLVGAGYWFRVVGGIVVVLIGIKVARERPIEVSRACRKTGLGEGPHPLASFGATLMLTLSNPATIVAVGALFAAFGPHTDEEPFAASAVLVGGVFAGSALWFTLLAALVDWVRPLLKPRTLFWINRACGIALVAFGLAMLGASLRPFV